MTAVKQMLKELQENFPKQMADMYDSNQLLLEDIALKAKEMEKEQIIETARYYFHEQGKFTPEQYYNETFKSE